MGSKAGVNISGDKSEDRWGVFYEELCRRIDHQINENARLEEQALFILRIILATIGLILTALSVLGSTGNLSLVFSSINSEEISNVATGIVTTIPYFGENQRELITAVLLAFIAWYFIKSIFHLFIQVPKYSYKVLQPTVLEPSSAAPQMEVYYKEGLELENIRHSIIEKYSDLAESNRSKIESTRSSWESCYQAMRKGTVSFGIAFILGISITVIQNANVVLLLLVVFTWSRVRNIQYRDVMEEIEKHLVYDLKVDTSIAAVIFTAYFLPYNTPTPILGREVWKILFVIALIANCLLIALCTKNVDYEYIERYAKRTYVFAIIILLVVMVISLGTSPEYQRESANLGNFLILSLVFLMIESVTIAMMIPVRKGIGFFANNT